MILPPATSSVTPVIQLGSLLAQLVANVSR
jgi:hypothetical protein